MRKKSCKFRKNSTFRTLSCFWFMVFNATFNNISTSVWYVSSFISIPIYLFHDSLAHKD